MKRSLKEKVKQNKSVRQNVIVRFIVWFILVVILMSGGFYALIEMTPMDLSKLTATTEPTVVYDKTGAVYMTIGETPTNLNYNQIPKNLQNAIVATEDHIFWTGSSIDFRSILRSLFVDISTGSASQGASTIEEQLAKIVYLNDNKTLSYKLKQMVMGVQLDRYFTKQEILTMYLNKLFLGENTVGVEQAAMRYFGVDLAKNPNSLTLDEAALLAGLPQAPTAYDPLVHPQAALTRRNEVLQNMVKYGYITHAQATAAESKPLGAKYHSIPEQSWDTHPLFANVLFDYAAKNGITPQQLLGGGLKVYTTIDPKVQRAVHAVFWSGNYDTDFPGAVQGAGVFLDPKTGGILGAAGTRRQGYVPFGANRIDSNSSPGSSIKPIMEYAPAITSGNWGPLSILDNQPQDFGGGYIPQNWEGPGGPSKVTLQYGLQWSQNIASVWLLKQIGLQTGIDFALNDGIQLTQQDRQQLGIAIGGMQYGVNPLEMAQAYEPFDNNGVQMKAHLIKKVVNQDGQIIYQFLPSSTVVMTQATATVMTSLMQDVVDFGTGTSAQVPGWGVAGKTGTVQYSAGLNSSASNWIRDAWFDGYTPNIVGSIHIGYDVSSSEHHMTMYPLDPSANAAKVFGDIVRLAEEGDAPRQFSVGPYPPSQGTASSAYSVPGNNLQSRQSNSSNSPGNITGNVTGNTQDNNTGNNSGNITIIAGGNTTSQGNTVNNIPSSGANSTTSPNGNGSAPTSVPGSSEQSPNSGSKGNGQPSSSGLP